MRGGQIGAATVICRAVADGTVVGSTVPGRLAQHQQYLPAQQGPRRGELGQETGVVPSGRLQARVGQARGGVEEAVDQDG